MSTGSVRRRSSAGSRNSAGMDVSEAQRLKALEDENRRLKLLVAELSLHGEALKGVIRKKRLELAGLRADVAFAQAEHGLSERTACKLLGRGAVELPV